MADQKALSGDSESLVVHVVTPRGPVADEETDAVTAPGEQGEFEVLPQHISFLTALHPGVLTLGENQSASYYALGKGYLRVNHAGDIEILVEKAMAAADVDVDESEKALKKTASELDDWTDAENAEWKNLKSRHDWAQACLDAHGAAS